MDIARLLSNKTIKPKEKTETLSNWLLGGKLTVDNLTEFARNAKDPLKATCIEALEFATKQNPAVANKKTFLFVTDALTEKAPRVKWESARVIGNTAHLFHGSLGPAIKNLLSNTGNGGTVVRWCTAFALGEILKLVTSHNKALLPAIEAACEKEEKNSIRKIYFNAIKKTEKTTVLKK